MATQGGFIEQEGLPTNVAQHKLDSINRLVLLPEKKLEQVIAMPGKLAKEIPTVHSMTDSVQVIQEAKDKLNEVNKVTTAAGLGPVGQGLTTNVNTALPGGVGMPNAPALNTGLPNPGDPSPAGGMGNVMRDVEKSAGANMSVPNMTGKGLPGLPNEASEVKNAMGEMNGVMKDAGQVTREVQQYSNAVKNIQENGISGADKLAEQQAMKIGELQAMEKEKAAAEQQMKQYKELVEQYKSEQAIKAEMEKKSKELAHDKMQQYQGKVNESMNKIKLSKYQRKFSHVQDARYLPKHAPNPMNGLGWRERLVPGFTLQTVNKNKSWVELSPQLYYRINGRWSAGAGWIYRFSMNASKLTFDDFGNLSGYRVFVHWSMFKGFFVRAEAGQVIWKPWSTLAQPDPPYRERVTAMALGIGKAYNFSKKTRGTMQTLYH